MLGATSAPPWCCSRSSSGCSGWSGAPARLFVGSLLVAGVGRRRPGRLADPSGCNRITGFTDPFKDFQGSGWQAGHGILGMASGGLFGKGIGASQQKWGDLPEAHTDFIFAVLGEELGLVGTLLVLGALPHHRVRRRCGWPCGPTDPFVPLQPRPASSSGSIGQMVINIGMVLALLPVIGIPLPLVSYGGSALVPDAGGPRPADRLRPARAGAPRRRRSRPGAAAARRPGVTATALRAPARRTASGTARAVTA